ncbi:hypothetical protein, partial [Pseudomonas karstica]|uniref:hypothetical protein n=1 Tax=Pseudomonas karstica TaxID=1055468 RepID=UPI00360FA893
MIGTVTACSGRKKTISQTVVTGKPVAAGAACDRLRSSRLGLEIAEGPAALIAASCLGSGYKDRTDY